MNLLPTSLIIASRNRPKLLNDAIDSILNGNELPKEIVIVDQSDTLHPSLAEIKNARGCEICYQWSRSVGISLARNIAFRMARYDYLVLTDDDVTVTPNWLSELIQALERAGPKCVISGRVLISETSDNDFAPSLITDEHPAVYQGRIWKDALWTNNMAMHRSTVGEIGFFDERLGPGSAFPSAEDNDYGFRLLEAGYRIQYWPSAFLYHRSWRSKKEYLPLRWKYGLGRGGFYAKHFTLRDLYNVRRMLGDVLSHFRALPYDFRRDRLS